MKQKILIIIFDTAFKTYWYHLKYSLKKVIYIIKEYQMIIIKTTI
jgi:hypothetical protein